MELVHPWPEWMELMEVLVKQNYFDLRRQRDDDDEDEMMVHSLGIDVSPSSSSNVGAALLQDFRAVQNACVNFGKDRFDILRFVQAYADVYTMWYITKVSCFQIQFETLSTALCFI